MLPQSAFLTIACLYVFGYVCVLADERRNTTVASVGLSLTEVIACASNLELPSCQIVKLEHA